MRSIIQLTSGDDFGVYVAGRFAANGTRLLFRGTFEEALAFAV